MFSKLVEGNCLFRKPRIKIELHGKKKKKTNKLKKTVLHPKIGNRQGCLPSLLLVSIILEFPAGTVRQEKVVKGIKNYQEIPITTMRKTRPLFRCYLKSSFYMHFLYPPLACNPRVEL